MGEAGLVLGDGAFEAMPRAAELRVAADALKRAAERNVRRHK